MSEAAEKEDQEKKNQRWNTENPGVDFKLKVDVPMTQGMMGEGASVDVPAGSIVRVLIEGIDFNRLQGWNEVEIGWNQAYYSTYRDDVTKHANRM